MTCFADGSNRLRGIAFVLRLVQSILEIEGRGGQQLRWVALDGNNLGDQGMGFFAGLLRISNAIEALQLRNVGVTARGFSEVVAGLVGNQSLALLDLRCNGLCPTDAAKASHNVCNVDISAVTLVGGQTVLQVMSVSRTTSCRHVQLFMQQCCAKTRSLPHVQLIVGMC